MKINKILLMVTPAFSVKKPREINPLPPVGLGYLASVIESMGIEVRIFDALVRGWDQEEEVNDEIIRIGLTDREIEDYLGDFNPDLVGINCQFSRQYKMYHHIFALIKKINPECITVAGGAHATVCPEEVLADPCCDFVLVGEGEDSFKELILALIKETNIETIDGLGWKANGKLNINEKRKWITDLDSISFPAYHLMELDRYFGIKFSHGERHRDRYAPIVTSRGCPAKCTFCTARMVWGNKYRMRSVDNVLKEMRLLEEQYGIEEIMFEDDNVTANPKRAKKLFSSMIEEGFNFIWDTPNGVGVWSIDEDLIDLMKRSGCIKLCFPVESGSQYVLDNIIKKPLNLSRVKQLIEHCRKINLNYKMFLVVGMPGEKIEDMWKSFRFAADCGCYAPHVSVATPYPGSQLYETCKKNGYFSREFTLDDLYIRSFLIKTPDWSENDLRKILLKGQIYFKYRMLVDDPGQFVKWFLSSLKKERRSELISYVKRTFFTRLVQSESINL
ncbi:MAG: radical SAM protein [Desulfobaccales bacterium]|nr:radical SAM protein [Desulfobaccales bacterium]